MRNCSRKSKLFNQPFHIWPLSTYIAGKQASQVEFQCLSLLRGSLALRSHFSDLPSHRVTTRPITSKAQPTHTPRSLSNSFPANNTMRECISIHIGQAGIQTGEYSLGQKQLKNWTAVPQRTKKQKRWALGPHVDASACERCVAWVGVNIPIGNCCSGRLANHMAVGYIVFGVFLLFSHVDCLLLLLSKITSTWYTIRKRPKMYWTFVCSFYFPRSFTIPDMVEW